MAITYYTHRGKKEDGERVRESQVVRARTPTRRNCIGPRIGLD